MKIFMLDSIFKLIVIDLDLLNDYFLEKIIQFAILIFFGAIRLLGDHFSEYSPYLVSGTTHVFKNNFLSLKNH